MALTKDFWKAKPLKDFTKEEWEAVCDGCGNCCYRKYIDGHGKNTKLYYTSIACDYLNIKNGKCSCYDLRFKENPECTHLTKKNIDEFTWLPENCAYRLLSEGKDLPSYHPLITGSSKSVKESGIMIKRGIHEKDTDNWEDHILKVKPYTE